MGKAAPPAHDLIELAPPQVRDLLNDWFAGRIDAMTLENRAKDLDSADHRSHMAYRYYDGSRADPVCPKDYPYIIPTFQLGAW